MYQHDTYRPSSAFGAFPPVIKNLLIINGLVFLAQFTLQNTNEQLLIWFALWPLGVNFMPWQLVSYSFLHGGLGHLFFNMFALWMFGLEIERTWGSRRFVIYYGACVIGAGLVQLFVALSTGGGYPTIGASGGVFGILLAFGMMFPNRVIMLLFPPIPMKAKYFVIGYGVLELYFVFTNAQPGVANMAHLGGMAFGYLLIMYWRGKLPIQPRHRTHY